jgi:hypothetical protein
MSLAIEPEPLSGLAQCLYRPALGSLQPVVRSSRPARCPAQTAVPPGTGHTTWHARPPHERFPAEYAAGPTIANSLVAACTSGHGPDSGPKYASAGTGSPISAPGFPFSAL